MRRGVAYRGFRVVVIKALLVSYGCFGPCTVQAASFSEVVMPVTGVVVALSSGEMELIGVSVARSGCTY